MPTGLTSQLSLQMAVTTATFLASWQKEVRPSLVGLGLGTNHQGRGQEKEQVRRTVLDMAPGGSCQTPKPGGLDEGGGP